MLIPTKFSGYQAGIRLYPGGGGSSGPAPQSSFEAMTGSKPTNMQGNSLGGSAQAMGFPQAAQNTAGGFNAGNYTSTTGNPIPWYSQAANYNLPDAQRARVIAGETSTGPTPSTTGGVSTGGTSTLTDTTPSETGETKFGEKPARQPIYKSQYNNYANPLTAGSVSNYGTVEAPSRGYMAAMAPGGGGLANYYQGLRNFGNTQGSQPYGMDYATFNPARKAIGASQSDLMAANSYNPMQGFGYGGGQLPQMQTPFNPYTNSYQNPFSYGGGQSQMELPAFGFGNQRSPFSYGGGAQLPQSMYGGVYGGMGGMGGQQQFMQQPQQYMQQPPQYMQQPSAPAAPIAPRSSGPSQPILSRAAMARGAPNVMRRGAEGGIMSLLDDSE